MTWRKNFPLEKNILEREDNTSEVDRLISMMMVFASFPKQEDHAFVWKHPAEEKSMNYGKIRMAVLVMNTPWSRVSCRFSPSTQRTKHRKRFRLPTKLQEKWAYSYPLRIDRVPNSLWIMIYGQAHYRNLQYTVAVSAAVSTSSCRLQAWAPASLCFHYCLWSASQVNDVRKRRMGG